MLRVVGLGTWIAIDQSVLQGAVDEDREFARSRRDGLGFADAERESTVERPKGRLAAAEVHGRQSKDRGSAIRRWLRATAQDATT